MPLNTDDLDLVVDGASGNELHALVDRVVVAISRRPEVQVSGLAAVTNVVV
jgi:hypothetical protein